jgi:hypothetical protein
VSAAYATEDEQTIRHARDGLEDAGRQVVDLGHRAVGAELRAQRAEAQAGESERVHAAELIAEREVTGRELAGAVTRAAREAVRLHRSYGEERSLVDRLVSAAGGEPRSDGCSPEHELEDQLSALDRARQRPEISAPTPRWTGLAYREAEDEKAKVRRLGRRKSAGIL